MRGQGLITGALLTTIAVWMYLHSSLGTLDPDSAQYLQFAGELSGYPIPQVGGMVEFADGRLWRPPLYSVLLAFGMTVTGGSPVAAIKLVHALSMVLAFAVLVGCLPKGSSSLKTFLLYLIATIPVLRFSQLIVPVWICYQFAVVAFSFGLLWLRTKKIVSLTLLTGALQLLALTRADYAVLLVLPVFFLAHHSRSALKTLLCGLGAFSPILLWLTINAATVGCATLSPLGSYTLLSSAVTLGEPRAQASDSQATKRFVEFLQATRIPTSLSQRASVANPFNDTFADILQLNFWKISDYQRTQNVEVCSFIRLSKKVAFQTLKEHPVALLQLLVAVFAASLWLSPILLYGLLRLKRRDTTSLDSVYPLAACWTYSAQVLYLLVVGMLGGIQAKHFAPMLSVTLLAGFLLVADQIRRRSSG
ncbi:MAG: hypothetical protein KDD69_15520 [Bdellovibrionales bacterium]|nr:hypothetical protein [Bdellovibrionales bacterium]